MSTSHPIEALSVKQLGRYQLRLRTFLCLPFIVALVWWLAGLALDLKASFIELLRRRSDIQAAIAFHEKQAITYQASAGAEIPDQVTELQLGRDRVCRSVTRPLTEAEIECRKILREHAALRAVYHLAMKKTYESASWTLWRTIPPDPPPPSIPRRHYSPRLLHGE